MVKIVKRIGISLTVVICTVAAAMLPQGMTVNGAKQQRTEVIAADRPLPSLKEIYADQFLVGNVYNPSSQEGIQKEMLLKHFNVVTPENLLKPDAVQRQEGKFTFGSADSMVRFCGENNLQTVGHTFVWHQQTSAWMTENVGREEAIEHMKTHIQTVAGRYQGKMLAWDVVNEAIRDGARLPADGDWTKCLRETGWLSAIGSDYIKLAFTFAHEADPNAKLYYNDYGLDYYEKAKIAAAMFRDLKAQGVPIDGIGMQSHYSTSTSVSNVERSIELFEQTGAEISITELDVGVDGIDIEVGLTKEQEKKQAVLYAQLFLVYLEHAETIERVTFWGLDDTNTWRRGQYPCLFHSDYSPKEAFYAVADPYAYLGIPQIIEIDKSALDQAIQEADKITDQDQYTAKSFAAFQEAKKEAVKVYEEIPAEAEKSEALAYVTLIDATVVKLNKARENLRFEMMAVDKSVLAQVIQEADKITDQNLYTKESWEVFKEAKREAVKVYEEIPEEAKKSEILSYEALITETADRLKAAREKLSQRVETIFADVSEGEWFVPYVQYVYEHRIMTGMDKTLFGPAVSLSRGQFATILHRMENSPKMEYEAIFPDVANQEFYTEAVIWANKAGIVKGYEDTGRFGPADLITREQMVVMMYRYAKEKKYDVTMSSDMDGFSDKDAVTPFAKEAFAWAVEQKIITGDQGKLNPQGETSRAACAAIIMRFTEIYK